MPLPCVIIPVALWITVVLGKLVGDNNRKV